MREHRCQDSISKEEKKEVDWDSNPQSTALEESTPLHTNAVLKIYIYKL
jgi:hypothetical protein